MSQWYTVRLSEQYSFQVTLKSRNTVNAYEMHAGWLIPYVDKRVISYILNIYQ